MSTTDKMSENLKDYRVCLEEIRAHWRSDGAKHQDLEAPYTEARGTHGAFARRRLATTGEGGR
jgi:hypothetical protein